MIILLSLIAAFSISYSSSSTPRYPVSVVIDAGHGGIDGGAVGYSGKTCESDITLSIALCLEKYFQAAEIGVVMTRRDKNGLYGNKGEGFKKRDMFKRKEIILASGADLVISIHLNKFPSTSRKGAQAFFREESELGKLAAFKIQEQLNKNINLHRAYEALRGDYYLLSCSEIPSVIVECGFLSNPEEEMLLTTPEYQDKLAYNIFAGAVSYFCSTSKINVNL